MPNRTVFAAVFRLFGPAVLPGFVSKLSASFYHSHENSRELLEIAKQQMERVKGIETARTSGPATL